MQQGCNLSSIVAMLRFQPILRISHKHLKWHKYRHFPRDNRFCPT
jgi:hypothetical protein